MKIVPMFGWVQAGSSCVWERKGELIIRGRCFYPVNYEFFFSLYFCLEGGWKGLNVNKYMINIRGRTWNQTKYPSIVVRCSTTELPWLPFIYQRVSSSIGCEGLNFSSSAWGQDPCILGPWFTTYTNPIYCGIS